MHKRFAESFLRALLEKFSYRLQRTNGSKYVLHGQGQSKNDAQYRPEYRIKQLFRLELGSM